MEDTDIYRRMDILYHESERRKRFFKSKSGIITILRPLEEITKFQRRNKLVNYDPKKHKDESKIRKQIRFEIEADGEILHWDVRDHFLKKIKDFIGKKVRFEVIDKGNWVKSELFITENLDTEDNGETIEVKGDIAVKPKKELSKDREIEILENLTTMLEEIREGVEYEGVRNEDEFFEYVWHKDYETKEEQKFIRDWVILTRPQKKEIKRQIKSKNSDTQVEVENFKIILNEASKRPAWAPKDYHGVLQCLWRLSERPRVVVKFWAKIVEKIPHPEKVWKSCYDQRLLDILSITGKEIREFHNSVAELRIKCLEGVTK